LTLTYLKNGYLLLLNLCLFSKTLYWFNDFYLQIL
jgi:hypothetical protein